jgi:hypothetical protein
MSLATLFEKIYDTFGEITIGELLESLEDPDSTIPDYLNFRNPELLNIIKNKLISGLPYS